MTFGYRFQVIHPVHGLEENCTNKARAREVASRMAKAQGDGSHMIVYDRLARRGAIEEWIVSYHTEPEKHGEYWTYRDGKRKP